MTTKLNADQTVAVAVDYFWQPMSTCPLSVKVQLLGAGGVATYGQYVRGSDGEFWHGWAPLPRKPKEQNDYPGTTRHHAGAAGQAQHDDQSGVA